MHIIYDLFCFHALIIYYSTCCRYWFNMYTYQIQHYLYTIDLNRRWFPNSFSLFWLFIFCKFIYLFSESNVLQAITIVNSYGAYIYMYYCSDTYFWWYTFALNRQSYLNRSHLVYMFLFSYIRSVYRFFSRNIF